MNHLDHKICPSQVLSRGRSLSGSYVSGQCMENKLLLVGHSYNSFMRLVFLAQLMMEAWKASMHPAGLGIIRIVLQFEIFHKRRAVMLMVIGIREEQYVSQS